MSQFFCLRETTDITDFISEALPLPAERVPLAQALGRVCCEDVRSQVSCPERNRSTRDGFAVRSADVACASPGTPVFLTLSGECRPGSIPLERLNRGEAWRVYTGSALPDGADAVVMQEFAAVDAPHSSQTPSQRVAISAPCAQGENVLAAGADVPQGAVLARAGQQLRSHDVALLSQFFAEAPAHRLPVVGIVSTGDEFCHASAEKFASQPQSGISSFQTCATCAAAPPSANSNALLLEALISALGARSANLGTQPDNRKALYEGLLSALPGGSRPCDVIVVIGGSSGGGRDHSAKVIASLPGCRLSGQDQKVSSGLPLTLARVGQTSILGLPGHSLSLALCGQVFLAALLHKLMGFADGGRFAGTGLTVQAQLGTDLPARGPAPTHYPAMLRSGLSGLVAWPVPAGTGKNLVLRDMDGWLTVPGLQEGGEDGLRKGASVPVRLFV